MSTQLVTRCQLYLDPYVDMRLTMHTIANEWLKGPLELISIIGEFIEPEPKKELYWYERTALCKCHTAGYIRCTKPFGLIRPPRGQHHWRGYYSEPECSDMLAVSRRIQIIPFHANIDAVVTHTDNSGVRVCQLT